MKTAEELNALKEDIETLNQKLAELTEEELAQVTGGGLPDISKRDFKFLDFEFAKFPTNKSGRE